MLHLQGEEYVTTAETIEETSKRKRNGLGGQLQNRGELGEEGEGGRKLCGAEVSGPLG